jgi:glyoxylase-like metal-dependent hydrolase (beta-lactamase superfamily II)
MRIDTIIPGVYRVPLGMVNIFLIECDGCLTLIDTGLPGSTQRILAAMGELGFHPGDLQHILITHPHMDHIGSLIEIRERTGAEAYMHCLDADLLRAGVPGRPVKPAPGLVSGLIYRLFIAPSSRNATDADPVNIENDLYGGEVLEFTRGLQVIHTPGHTAGHLVFLLPEEGGVLFTGDLASAMFGLGYPPIFEDFEQGLQSLAEISKLDFEIACLAHGKPILECASDVFKQKWGNKAAIIR